MQGSRRDFLLWTTGSMLLLAGCQRRGGTNQPDPKAVRTVRAQQGQTLAIVAADYDVPLELALHLNPRLPLGPLVAGTAVVLPKQSKAVPAQPAATPAPVASAPPFEIISRARWGAAPSKSNYDPMNGVTRITIHHTSELPGMTTNHDRTTVLNIQRLHHGHGWADIGYHFLIGRDGRVYEGRSVRAQGAHAGNNELNQHNLGIALIGDFMTQLPNRAQLDTLQRMIAYYQKTYRVSSQRVYGHRDLKATLCPGDRLYAWLNQQKASNFKT